MTGSFDQLVTNKNGFRFPRLFSRQKRLWRKGMPDMAMEKLKNLVESRQRWGENNLEHFYGYDWCEVCEEEEYVFGLTTEDMAVITPVYEAYEALADIAYNDLHADKELCDELRSEMDWLKQDTVDALDFGRFADLFGVSQVKAYCFFHKYEQWQIRQGLITFSVRGGQ